MSVEPVAFVPAQPVLSVRDLAVQYVTDAGPVRAVDGISFDLQPGEKLGLVGESGSGKSTMALALMRLLRPPTTVTGQILLEGEDLVGLSERRVRQLRSSTIGMIPQGAMNSLNPVARIEDQIVDSLQDHGGGRDKRRLVGMARDALESVGLGHEVGRRYPHELSGGMKQRVCIAIAVALRPRVVIADEPTSALDVVVQRQVMDTLLRLQTELSMSVILIGHDMGLMAQTVDRLAVMYAGKFAELSSIRDIFADPWHPYTSLLIESLPKLADRGSFRGIPGLPPSLRDLPDGCLFHPRCPRAFDPCTEIEPTYHAVTKSRFVACHLHPKES